MKHVKILFLSSHLFFSACSVLVPQPTPTATAINTPLSTNTPELTATFTPEATATNTPQPPTDTPESIANALDPQGTPDADWNGIPIMPDAIAGEGDSSGYIYKVNATTEEVIAFYDRELAALGYAPFATGDAENGSILAFYQKDADLLTVSVIEQNDGSVIVLIV